MTNGLRGVAATRVATVLGVFQVIGFEMFASDEGRQAKTALTTM